MKAFSIAVQPFSVAVQAFSIAMLASVLFLVGCGADAVESKTTDNPQVHVDQLFTHDGCTVYRFEDFGEPHYYVKCVGASSAATTSIIQHGKVTSPEEIPTEIPTETGK